MTICNPNNIKTINENECLFESINTINSNFINLSATACSLKERIDAIRLSRTFFYYGPNSNIVAYNDDNGTIPSDFTISTFVNSPLELDLQSVSRPGDIVYIVHQKTGILPTLDRIPLTYNISTTVMTRPTPILEPSILGGQYGADFLPGSFFMTYRRSINVTVQPRTGSGGTFKYSRIDSRKILLNNPIYTPTIIKNDNTITQVYTVKWTVTNESLANMPAGNYSFEFGIEPGEEFDFKKRMQTWLLTNLNRHDVNIEGNFEISATTNVTLPPTPRRLFGRRIGRSAPPPRVIPSVPLSVTTTRTTEATEIDVEIDPVFYVWRLTYEKRPARDANKYMYYIDNGWPRIFRAQTSGIDATNWNQPQTWTTYNSW
jgi:hypothetical protein